MVAVDLFSGCGGLSLGLEKAGIKIKAAFENWIPAIEVYRNNFKHPVHEFDLSQVELASNVIRKYKPNIIVGGPPCQDFSSAGKRDENGGRGDLTISFAQIVVAVKPQWFLMENVDRISKTEVFQEAKKILSEAGYGFTEQVLDASFCGVPQKRKRMFLIGKLNAENDFLKSSLISRLSSERLTVREYMGEKLNTEHYYRHARSYARRGIFSVDEPSPTIRGVNRPVPPGYKIHNGDSVKDLSKVRPLTALERSFIQTFPETFKWVDTNKSTLEQIIGNAVPVNLAQFVGSAIVRYERRNKQIEKKKDLLAEVC